MRKLHDVQKNIRCEYICREDNITGFERVLRISNGYGFWWFLQVTGDFEASIEKAIKIVDDIINKEMKSEYSFNHYLLPL